MTELITIDFSNRGELGLCEYLYTNIANQILDGTLKPNEKLPSKRALSSHLKVSIITVQNAYSELISLGFIYSIEKKGFFVTDLELSNPSLKKNISSGTSSSFNSAMPSVSSSASSSQSIPKIEEKQHTEYFADFQSNESASQKFPFKIWATLMRRVLNSENPALLERQNVFGAYELRKSISKYLKEFRNMNVSPDQIIISAGTESLYSMLVQFLGNNNIYAVENPGYHKVASIINLNGAEFLPIDLDNQGINISQLEKSKASILHISPAHHFPTGVVTSIKRRGELLSWVNSASDRFIIEDEYDSEFRFNGKPIQPLWSFAQNNGIENKIIYINTFSKTLAPSFRLSYMVLPAKSIPAFNKKLGFFSCPVPTFEQYTLSLFINEGHFEKHLIRMKNHYRNLRNSFITLLNSSKIAQIGNILEEESGLHFLLQIRLPYSEEEIKNRLKEQKINLPLLSDFQYSKETKSQEKDLFTFVVNYSTLTRSNLSETVAKLEAAFI